MSPPWKIFKKAKMLMGKNTWKVLTTDWTPNFGGIRDFECFGDYNAPIAQGEISMSVAFPTHVWKMPNICNHIIVWLFSHMCAFSHTYVSKSKHVWKKAPRCKYTNVFGFFQTCWVKVKHLPKCNLKHRFGFFLTYLQKQTCKEKTNMFSLNSTILFFL